MKHLLLLHGAIGSKKELEPLSEALSSTFNISSLNFSGHGGDGSDNQFTIETFAEQILQWMKIHNLDSINIFGYSMGGYVALYLARHYPYVVESIITLGTKYEWTNEVAAKEVSMLNPAAIEVKVPKFALQLKQRHYPADWKDLVNKTADMLSRMGANPPLKAEDFKMIKSRVLLLLGDRDKMVTLSETVDVFNKLPSAQLGVLPNTSHPLEFVDIELLAIQINKFLQ